ncbi:UDP-N-acetylmuramate dehydrogenase [Candidatus Accumulibacter sp. ACC003]|uniref:UDP-N-acetylmuramate dehydrogenase n=1 Tax=Candidatus Accumulibacter sp. ACC003 TaxID=2823334 RepID=UPI0025BB2997|nr:UDP-N-acetylmuramate dehydrogenase [Candidatus Accumulibacter sp. ACC003]
MSERVLPDFVARDVDLAKRTTLALPGRAALYAEVSSLEQLAMLAGDSLPRRFVVGAGSNLVLSGDFDGLLLHMAMRGRELLGDDADAWYVRAAAGENWHQLVLWTLAQGWPGLENLALIPGTVGAAPIQNIGAYGLEVAERLHAVEALDMSSGRTLRFDRAACRFAYRDSVFKQEGWHLDGRQVITRVVFRLPKAWQPLASYADVAAELERQPSELPPARPPAPPTPRRIADAVMAVRRRKLPDPATLPNAGSFFHNPVVSASVAQRLAIAHPEMPRYPQADGRVKLAAAWLIEGSGWKGRNLGRVGMYEQQALVLVNRGGACGAEVIALARAVQADVRQHFGVDLTPEPIFL